MARKQDSRNVSRRDVLLGTSTTVMAGLLTGTGSKTARAEPTSPGAAGGHPAVGPGSLVTRQTLDADVVVAGGGMAGVCAALAAARHGASVVLIQDRPVLGGNASSEVRMHIVGADGGGLSGQTDTRETGIIEELRLTEAVSNPQRSASMLDLVLYDAVRREPNITLLLDTHCVGVQMASPQHITAALASRHGTEDLFTIQGKVFLDCTGDGRLGVEAGADFRMGREAQSEYSESLAPPQADNKVLGSTLLFITRQHDRPMPFQPPPWIRRFPNCQDLPHRSHGGWEYGYWWVEWGGELDTIKDNERIRQELMAAALGVWDHIKNSGHHPKSENWALEWLGFLPGKRESRRFLGDYVLREQDCKAGERFEDGVAFGGWPIDLHPPEGIYSPERPAIQIRIPLYNIPYRCLYSRNVANLMFAGRNISASHVAFGSTRVMATCAVMGQAVGTAAAMCAHRGCLPRELGRDAIGDLQQLLLKDDAYILGISNRDPLDLARKARVRASSETADGAASQVINGIHRRVNDQTNRWVSDPAHSGPHWIELQFPEPQRIREVHLVFDTGLQRHLTLSHSDGHTARMVRAAQPETVRDYELSALDGSTARTVATVEGNYQRKRIHTFEPLTAGGIRLTIKATQGDPSARVFEIRAYA